MYFELKKSIRDTQKYITYFNNFANTEIFMSFLEKTSMFRIKVCQAVKYNVTGSSVTKYFLTI